MIVAGIGSREAPRDAEEKGETLGALFAVFGWLLRSGAAVGMDLAFEKGFDRAGGTRKQIFRSEDAEPWCRFILSKHDCLDRGVSFANMGDRASRLIQRDAKQILGQSGKEPVDLVVLWTPTADPTSKFAGGTRYAARLARNLGIPIFHLGKLTTE